MHNPTATIPPATPFGQANQESLLQHSPWSHLPCESSSATPPNPATSSKSSVPLPTPKPATPDKSASPRNSSKPTSTVATPKSRSPGTKSSAAGGSPGSSP